MSDTIQRYWMDDDDGPQPADDGNGVLHADHLAAITDLKKALKARLSCDEIDELCCELGAPEYRQTDDGEARYWCFSGRDLPVADTLSELLIAARAALEAK